MKPITHFMMAVLALCLPAHAGGQGLSVETLSSTISNNAITLHLRNKSALTLIGITVGRGGITEEDLALQPAQKILGHQAFDFRFPGTDTGELEIRALLFEDGSGEGDPQLVRVMAARLDGAKAASRTIIQALTEESNRDRLLEKLEASPGTPGSIHSVVPSRELALSRLPLAQRQEITHAYASGYLGTKERALREVRKLSAPSKEERQAISAANPFEELRVYFDNVLAVGRRSQ